MANSKHLRGQLALPGFAPPPPADRETALREIVFRILAVYKRGQTLNEIMLSTAWVGLRPPAAVDEVKSVLHGLVGEGVLDRAKGDDHFWIYCLRRGIE